MTACTAREIVLVDCPDDVGLIHRITGVLQARQLNIESNHEFVDSAARHFFFRAEVAPAAEPVPADALRAALAAVLPAGRCRTDSRPQPGRTPTWCTAKPPSRFRCRCSSCPHGTLATEFPSPG